MTTLFGSAFGADGKVVVVGLPFDHGSDLHGCRRGPSTLRFITAGHYLNECSELLLVEASEFFLTADCVSDIGDIPYFKEMSRASYLAQASEAIGAILRAGKIPLVLGGDHTVAYAGITACSQQFPHVQVIQLDAHEDAAPVSKAAEITHANFVTAVSGINSVQSIRQIGVRGIRASYSMDPKVSQRSWNEALDALDPSLPVYLTIDADFFDPIYVPAVSHPVPAGGALKDLQSILHGFQVRRMSVVGADLCEYNPEFDTRNSIAGHYLSEVLLSLISFLSRQRSWA